MYIAKIQLFEKPIESMSSATTSDLIMFPASFVLALIRNCCITSKTPGIDATIWIFYGMKILLEIPLQTSFC